MRIAVVSVFPEMVAGAMAAGIPGRALAAGLASLETVDPREFAGDVHRTVDDRPYGGGPGMVMKVAPWRAAIGAARRALPAGSPVVFLTPQGERFDQSVAMELAALPGIVLVAGRYEGFDERLVAGEADRELSVGDYVLSGGEPAALVVMDAVLRLLPGALGHADSATAESFMDNLLDYPHYTRPPECDAGPVPEVLLSGDHERIRRWRLKQALGRTKARRPDLLQRRGVSEEEAELLREYEAEQREAEQ